MKNIIILFVLSIIIVSCTKVTNVSDTYIKMKHIKNNYGIFILAYKSQQWRLFPIYYFFNKNNNTVIKTYNINELLNQIKSISNASEIDWYDTCTVSRMGELNEKIKNEIIQTCKSKNIKINMPDLNSYTVVCTCEAFMDKNHGIKER